MLNLKSVLPRLSSAGSVAGGLRRLLLVLLAVEFLDELVFGVREAAWPLIRNDLQLSYAQVGILLSVPGLVGNLVEPPLAILSDVWKRRALILAGGIFFAAATLAISLSWSFTVLLIALVVINPSSGMFVGLSQAVLMDAESARQEQNMARWELSGALGNVVGPLALAACLMLGLGWRSLFASFFLLTLVLIAAAWRFPLSKPLRLNDGQTEQRRGILYGVREAWRALHRLEVWRWLILLEFADLTMDGLHGFLALYLVDIVGMSATRASVSVFMWKCAALPGYVLLIRLLDRVRGLAYLRLSALAVAFLFTAFLIAPGAPLKLLLLCLIGFANAGWYSILKAQLYKSMPGQSGTVLAVANVFGLVGALTPLWLGLVAERHGLKATMWLMLLGPVALICALPRAKS
ncbi:MAG TPA: MFS transporter [Pyrinomonadaceae bacterium]|jgi:FSR family fosmidomycin resistance protein-like MFS transporter|nr:MFS transporter [Pyrinomonadaceae bacterium]